MMPYLCVYHCRNQACPDVMSGTLVVLLGKEILLPVWHMDLRIVADVQVRCCQ